MKKNIFFVFLLLFTTNIKADFVSINTAESAAVKYLSLKGEPTTITLVHTEYVTNTNTAMFYVFDISASGHIIISADDRMAPVRAYVPNSDYIFNSDNPGLAVWVYWHEKFFIDSIISFEQTERKINDWDFFTNPTTNYNVATITVGPLLSTDWSQSRNCENSVVVANTAAGVPVGCVATAAGQIMNYYQHPYRG